MTERTTTASLRAVWVQAMNDYDAVHADRRTYVSYADGYDTRTYTGHYGHACIYCGRTMDAGRVCPACGTLAGRA